MNTQPQRIVSDLEITKCDQMLSISITLAVNQILMSSILGFIVELICDMERLTKIQCLKILNNIKQDKVSDAEALSKSISDTSDIALV